VSIISRWLYNLFLSGTPREINRRRDNVIRVGIEHVTDYAILYTVLNPPLRDTDFGAARRKCYREEAMRRGLPLTLPISRKTNGYPVSVAKPIYVKAHWRRRSI